LEKPILVVQAPPKCGKTSILKDFIHREEGIYLNARSLRYKTLLEHVSTEDTVEKYVERLKNKDEMIFIAVDDFHKFYLDSKAEHPVTGFADLTTLEQIAQLDRQTSGRVALALVGENPLLWMYSSPDLWIPKHLK
jgi:hypothetical protein